MHQITATELRIKTKELFESLESGEAVDLIKGSRILGVALPKNQGKEKVFNLNNLRSDLRGIKLEVLPYKERERRYREYMENRYVKNLS